MIPGFSPRQQAYQYNPIISGPPSCPGIARITEGVLIQIVSVLSTREGAGMASIRERTRNDGTTAYIVLWREGGHRSARQRSKTFTDIGPARQLQDFLDANGQTYELALDAQEAAYAEGVTVVAASRGYLESVSGVEPQTYDHYESIIRNHITPRLGQHRVAALTGNDIRRWVNQLRDHGCAAQSISQYRAVLSAIMRWAIDEKIRDDNPCKGIRLPRVDKAKVRGKRIEYADFESIVIPEIPEGWRPHIRLLAGTGARAGECLALTVGAFTPGTPPGKRHPKRPEKDQYGTIDFTETWKGRGRKARLGMLKTDDSVREIPIDWELNDMLVELTEGRGRNEPLIPHPVTGQMPKYMQLEEVWHPAALRMADPHRPGGHMKKPPTLHWLRHAHGAWLLEQGVDIVTVSRRLGHSNIGTTANIYGHDTAGSKRAAADAMARTRAKRRG